MLFLQAIAHRRHRSRPHESFFVSLQCAPWHRAHHASSLASYILQKASGADLPSTAKRAMLVLYISDGCQIRHRRLPFPRCRKGAEETDEERRSSCWSVGFLLLCLTRQARLVRACMCWFQIFCCSLLCAQFGLPARTPKYPLEREKPSRKRLRTLSGQVRGSNSLVMPRLTIRPISRRGVQSTCRREAEDCDHDKVVGGLTTVHGSVACTQVGLAACRLCRRGAERRRCGARNAPSSFSREPAGCCDKTGQAYISLSAISVSGRRSVPPERRPPRTSEFRRITAEHNAEAQ